MVEGTLTIEQRDKLLKELATQKKEFLKRTKPVPLTLKLQSRIAGEVGRGRVGLEFKRRKRIKKLERTRGLIEFKKSREDILSIEIKKPKPIKPDPVIDPSSFKIDTKVDF